MSKMVSAPEGAVHRLIPAKIIFAIPSIVSEPLQRVTRMGRQRAAPFQLSSSTVMYPIMPSSACGSHWK